MWGSCGRAAHRVLSLDLLSFLHSRRCSCFLRRHCFLGIVLLGAAVFLSNMNMKLTALHSNPSLRNQTGWSGRLFQQQEAERSAAEQPSAHTADVWTTAGAGAAPSPTPPAAAGSGVPERLVRPYVVEYPSEYRFVINEPNSCEEEKPFVVLMVPVAPADRAHRSIIRRTWGGRRRVLGRLVRHFFLLGLQAGDGAQQVQRRLASESRRHRDLIQSDFVDSYRNLTIKTMVMLEWLDRHCPGAAYAMKVDSDMFLNVRGLVALLQSAPRTNYMTGHVDHRAPVQRNSSSKWFLPEQLFPRRVYPPYALGLGYVLSLDLPRKLVGASRHVRAVYIEDVYLGLCMEFLRIRPRRPPSRAHFQLEPVSFTRCGYSQIIVAPLPPRQNPVELWRNFTAPGPHC